MLVALPDTQIPGTRVALPAGKGDRSP